MGKQRFVFSVAGSERVWKQAQRRHLHDAYKLARSHEVGIGKALTVKWSTKSRRVVLHHNVIFGPKARKAAGSGSMHSPGGRQDRVRFQPTPRGKNRGQQIRLMVNKGDCLWVDLVEWARLYRPLRSSNAILLSQRPVKSCGWFNVPFSVLLFSFLTLEAADWTHWTQMWLLYLQFWKKTNLCLTAKNRLVVTEY